MFKKRNKTIKKLQGMDRRENQSQQTGSLEWCQEQVGAEMSLSACMQLSCKSCTRSCLSNLGDSLLLDVAC